MSEVMKDERMKGRVPGRRGQDARVHLPVHRPLPPRGPPLADRLVAHRLWGGGVGVDGGEGVRPEG